MEPVEMEPSAAAPAANDAPDRPIFVIGPHRSGTTLMYGLLSRHPQLGYLNHANRRMRRTPGLARLLTGGPFFRDKPIEAQKYWDLYWNTPDDVMDAEDATPEAIAFHRKSVRRVLALRGAPRFVAKYPRLSLRLGWIDRVFPGALLSTMGIDNLERLVLGEAHCRAGACGKRGEYSFGHWCGLITVAWCRSTARICAGAPLASTASWWTTGGCVRTQPLFPSKSTACKTAASGATALGTSDTTPSRSISPRMNAP